MFKALIASLFVLASSLAVHGSVLEAYASSMTPTGTPTSRTDVFILPNPSMAPTPFCPVITNAPTAAPTGCANPGFKKTVKTDPVKKETHKERSTSASFRKKMPGETTVCGTTAPCVCNDE